MINFLLDNERFKYILNTKMTLNRKMLMESEDSDEDEWEWDMEEDF